MTDFDDEHEAETPPPDDLPPMLKRSLAQQANPAMFEVPASRDEYEAYLSRSVMFWTYAQRNDVDGLRELFADAELTKGVAWSHQDIVSKACDAGSMEALYFLLGQGFGYEGGRISADTLRDVCRGRMTEEKTLEVVDDLINRGAALSDDRGTPLLLIAGIGYTQVAERLLRAGVPVRGRGKSGELPLIRAAYKGGSSARQWQSTVPMAELLITHGADVNECGSDGVTALHRAAQSCYLPMVELLLSQGADARAVDSGGDTPLHKLLNGSWTYRDVEDVADLEEVATLLLSAGADVNAVNSRGATPFITTVVFGGHESVLRLLLKRGANPNVGTYHGVSVLAQAVSGRCIRSDTARVEMLLEAGADPLAGSDGRAVIESAVFRGRDDVLELLFHYMTSPVDVFAHSAMMVEAAAKNDSPRTLELLLPYGLNIGATYPHGRVSPLHHAARRGAAKVLEMCLSAGSDPNVRDRLGRTPLYMAARYNRPDAITVLLRHGADATIGAKDGKTPLAIALEKNKKGAVAVL
ncbi:MAG: ankyrin repeat domain-containing protein [Armatimonadetes bacterium]|nr:ankyrin repeat domain-containing protein [Armatimonadota bacterium]